MRILVLTPGVFDKGGIARYGRLPIRVLRERHGLDLRLAREPELHRAERSAARRRVEEAFGYPAFADKTREAIRSLAPQDPGVADSRRRSPGA
jgi:hypothetical protein